MKRNGRNILHGESEPQNDFEAAKRIAADSSHMDGKHCPIMGKACIKHECAMFVDGSVRPFFVVGELSSWTFNKARCGYVK